MTTDEHGIDRIRRLAGQAGRRMRLVRAVGIAPRAASAALVVALVAVGLRKLGIWGDGPDGAARLAVVTSAGLALGAVVVAWLWPLPERDAARVLDRFHSLHDRLSSALAFASLSERTPFMEAAIADAVVASAAVRPGEAVPLRVPPGLGPAVVLGGALGALLLVHPRAHTAPAHVATIDPVDMAPDDLQDVKDFLGRMKQEDTTEETKAAVEEFNRLVDDIANHRIDRTEAFRRMAALEEKLASANEADRKALEAELTNVAQEMKKSDLLKPAAAALERADLDRARDELHELAKKERAHGAGIDKAKLEQMRAALKAAASDAEHRREQVEKRRQELADEILKRKEKAGQKPSDEEQSLLQKKQRELDHLDRDLADKQNAERRLDRLDRELQQAAEDLMKDLGVSADDLDQSAEELNQMDRGEASEKEKEELKQKLEELRQLVRQQGGQGQVQRLKRFGRMARGQSGQSGKNGQGGNGQEGQGQGEQGGDQGQSGGQQGQGQGPGQGDGQGQKGQNGQGGQGGQGGEVWVLGPNGEKMLLLTKGAGGSGSGSGENGGSGDSKGGPQRGRWGDGHDTNVSGKETNPGMGTQDSELQGADADKGASRSQVIFGAAERGFTSRPYQRVYTEYHQVAEESLAKDDVPGGYRFYVKRYFQLIRPRDDQK
jgi:hypothetical protein